MGQGTHKRELRIIHEFELYKFELDKFDSIIIVVIDNTTECPLSAERPLSTECPLSKHFKPLLSLVHKNGWKLKNERGFSLP
jgi:hypothetical protein